MDLVVEPGVAQPIEAGGRLRFRLRHAGGPRHRTTVRFEYTGPPLRQGKVPVPFVQVHVLRGEDALAGVAGEIATGGNVFVLPLPEADVLDGLEIELVSAIGWLRAPLAADAAGVLHGRGSGWEAAATVRTRRIGIENGLRAWETRQTGADCTLAILGRTPASGGASSGRRAAPIGPTGVCIFHHVPGGIWHLSLQRNGRPVRFRFGDAPVKSFRIDVGGNDLEIGPFTEIE